MALTFKGLLDSAESRDVESNFRYLDMYLRQVNSAIMGVGQPTGTFVESGCHVAWTGTGLVFSVTAGVYWIDGVRYVWAGGFVTLDAADPSDPRFDAIVMDADGATFITGTPAADPAQPEVDPLLYAHRTYVLVDTAATEPEVTEEIIYAESDAAPTEWTDSTSNSTFTLDSTNAPHSGTKSIEATGAASTHQVVFTEGGSFDITSWTTFTFWIKSKGTWPSQKRLRFQFQNGSSGVSNTLSIGHNIGGFDSSNTTNYQQIVFPMTDFGLSSTVVTGLRMVVAGAGSTIGFYVDDITMQGGMPSGGTGGIDGTGTAGFIPRWLDSDTLTDSAITASDAEINLLDLSGLTAGYVLAANTATTASWRQLLGSEINNDAGWLSTVDISADTNLAVSDPITLTGDTVGLGYNTTNLQITTNQLNTIQNIATTSSPTFAGGTISNTSANSILNLTASAGQFRILNFETGGSDRWYVGAETTAESGSNAGSNFILRGLSDAQSTLHTTTITRSTGTWTFPENTLTTGRLAVGTDNSAYDINLEKSVAGFLRGRVYNTSTNAAAASFFLLRTDGGDDVQYNFQIGASVGWSMGLDNSDSDTWKLSANATVGTSTVLKCTSGGDLYVTADLYLGDTLFDSADTDNLIQFGDVVAGTFIAGAGDCSVGIDQDNDSTTAGFYVFNNGSFTNKIFGVTEDGAVKCMKNSTGYFLLPSLTTTERNALTAVNGMLIYNTTTGKIEGREAGAWVDI